MIKISRQKLLLTTTVLTLLLISTYASTIPTVKAEPDTQAKTIDVLRNVVGIDPNTYAVVTNVPSSKINDINVNLPDKIADISLASDQGKVRVLSSFINNNLNMLYMTEYQGKFSFTLTSNRTINLAKSFLENYANYTGDAFYTALASTLDNVNPALNMSKSNGNIKLEVSNFDQKTVDYKWTYMDENGILAPKKDIILTYNEGRFQAFVNNWLFYKIAGTPKLSSEEATSIAIATSTKFSYNVSTDNVTSTITGFKIAPNSWGKLN